MKKFLTLFLTLSLLFALVGCGGEPSEKNTDSHTNTATEIVCTHSEVHLTEDKFAATGEEKLFTVIKYSHDGYFSRKSVENCPLGQEILAELSQLEESWPAPWLSDIVIDKSAFSMGGFLPSDFAGIMWIECATGELYRINADKTEICRVERHLGGGRQLKITEKLKELLSDAWYYYPKDHWRGQYKKGEITLTHVYPATSVIKAVEIDDISLMGARDDKTISLRLCAKEDATVKVWVESYHSDDNRGSEEVQEVQLKQGIDRRLDFTFSGWDITYTLEIRVDNTVLLFYIDPS